jgi:uncharacterized membrane protein YkvA (DUF1232 family)
MNEQNEYREAFSEQGLWSKLKKYAVVAGREVVEKAPAWAKAAIAAALGYCIVPLVPSRT